MAPFSNSQGISSTFLLSTKEGCQESLKFSHWLQWGTIISRRPLQYSQFRCPNQNTCLFLPGRALYLPHRRGRGDGEVRSHRHFADTGGIFLRSFKVHTTAFAKKGCLIERSPQKRNPLIGAKPEAYKPDHRSQTPFGTLKHGMMIQNLDISLCGEGRK